MQSVFQHQKKPVKVDVSMILINYLNVIVEISSSLRYYIIIIIGLYYDCIICIILFFSLI